MEKYSLEQSPLFRVQTLGALSRMLKMVSPERLCRLEQQNQRHPELFYHRHDVGKRDVQALRGELRSVHRRLYGLLSRINTPDYLISSQTGLSSIDNAKRHQDPGLSVLSLDIKKFFARTRYSAVFRFFLRRLEVAPDLAHLLANLCCYQGKRLPLGSPVSQPLAFWAHEALFQEIARYAGAKGMTFSVFVDDLTFSSRNPIPQGFHREVQAILVSRCLAINGRKTRYQPAGRPKLITGCVVLPQGELAAPAALLKTTGQAIRHFRDAASVLAGQRALGSISAVRAIVPGAYDRERHDIIDRMRRLRRLTGPF